MAPLSVYIAKAMYEVNIKRNLGSSNSTGMAPDLTHSQSNVLQCLALVFSTISVASAILAFYWFMKMQRIFRHDLVMLLIQSDMFKALWFMIYPIVTFVHGPVSSNSKFCNINGFFISVGIEASDIAVLMIAIHSALYIFKPRVAQGEGGLYPYRNIAYVIWLVVPVILSSLAFINKGDSYVTEGTYCYLPVRPFWYRLALAWIPRYVIFIFILGIYASIYFYVRYKFHGFTKENSDATDDNSGEHSEKPPKRPKQQGLPPTPMLICHGLITEPRQPSITGDVEGGNISSAASHTLPPPISSPESANQIRIECKKSPPVSSPGSAHRFMWANLIAVEDTPPSQSTSPDLSPVDADLFSGPITPRPLPHLVTSLPSSPQARSVRSVDPSHSRDTSWRDGFASRLSLRPGSSDTSRRSMVDIFSVLRHRPGETEAPTPISQLQLVNSRGQNLAESEMLKTRDKIRRQLRFLFIYPLVYIGMWILPFVSHVMQYDDKYALYPPFGLTCVTTICVCSQAAVDCWLFSTREKPWKHIPGTNGSFFSSLKFWTGWKGFLKRRVKAGPGKTREEMVREARAAYRRRDEEMAQRRSEAGIAGALQDPRRGERSWWEGAGQDGVMDMTPAVEVSNPIEAVVSPIVRQERVHFRVPEDNEERVTITRTTSREDHAST